MVAGLPNWVHIRLDEMDDLLADFPDQVPVPLLSDDIDVVSDTMSLHLSKRLFHRFRRAILNGT